MVTPPICLCKVARRSESDYVGSGSRCRQVLPIFDGPLLSAYAGISSSAFALTIFDVAFLMNGLSLKTSPVIRLYVG